jgi:two-component system chemotaxis sensor kinase CheA
MDREELQRRLMQTYLEEVDDQLRALDPQLLALEAAADGPARHELVHLVFRAMHSLKGASRAVSVHAIERVCHALEHRLDAVREGSAPLAPPVIEMLFAAVDAIRDAVGRLRGGASLAGSPIEALLPQVSEAAAPEPPAATAATATTTTQPTPTPTPAPEVREPSLAAAAPAAAPMVRVRADKLDAVLARSAELLVARGRLESRERELATTAELVERLDAEVRAVAKPLRRMLRSASGTGSPTNAATGHGAHASHGAHAGNGRAGDGANGGGSGHRLAGRTAGHASSVALAGAGLGLGRAYSTPVRLDGALSRIQTAVRALKSQLDRAVSSEIQDARVLRQAAVPLDEAVHRLRMFPFGEACEGLARAARDVAKATGVSVELAIEGGEVELDRAILDGLRAPLLHLVRNAVHHGVEPPAERTRAGKPPTARITVAARLRGAQVDVTVDDDGRGLDLDAIRGALRRRGLAEPADPQELARAIFQPGFSTAAEVTAISGRGVGLDVVASSVGALHGTVEVTWQPGLGTRMTLGVPLTLSTIRALGVVIGGQTFAFPGTNVHKVLKLRRSDLLSIEGMPALVVGGRPIAVQPLGEVLGIARSELAADRAQSPAVVIASGDKRMAFLVDELIAEQELVIKSLGRRLAGLELVAGASILPSGRLGLILNAAAVIQRALAPGEVRGMAHALTEPIDTRPKRLLVVDDVVTTRSLVKSLLEAAGYEVGTATDGADAWRALQDRGADVVVTDIEMPRMDGFELTRQIRASERFRDLPVILVTGLDSQRDKERGAQAGANAYLVKSEFDQGGLLDAIGRLL